MARTKKSKPEGKRRAANKAATGKANVAPRPRPRPGRNDVKDEVAGTFRFLDMPKELRIRVYDFAFAEKERYMIRFGPTGRHFFARICGNDQVYNTSHGMSEELFEHHPTHPLLLINKMINNEAGKLFFDGTDFDIRMDAADTSKRSKGSRHLGAITDVALLQNAQHVSLQLGLEQAENILAFHHGVRQLITALGRGRKLASLDIKLHYDWTNDSDEDRPAIDETRALMAALGSFACTAVSVEWADYEGSVGGLQWVPMAYRAMARDLEVAIVWNGLAIGGKW